MCGIAGIIHRDGTGDIGTEITSMLQSMKHRGPDSSGFALYGPPNDLLVMRIKLADPNEVRGFGWSERLERHRNEVEHRLAKIGAMVDVIHGDQEYAYRVTFRYSGELKPLVLYESPELVALASEEVAIRTVIGREIDTYDPYEREVLVWHR